MPFNEIHLNSGENRRNETLPSRSLLFELWRGIQAVPNRKDRPQARLSDLICCICAKTFNCLAARRNDSDVQDAFEKDYISQKIHYNTLYKHFDGKVLLFILPPEQGLFTDVKEVKNRLKN